MWCSGMFRSVRDRESGTVGRESQESGTKSQDKRLSVLIPGSRFLAPGSATKQETPVLFGTRVRVKLGTDLLSHVLPQYHRLWRA